MVEKKKAKQPKFRKGQVVHNGINYFAISAVIPCYEDGENLSGYRYLDVWSSYQEKALRPLTSREIGPRPRPQPTKRGR